MKNIKRLLALLLVVAMAMTMLIGCGENVENPTSSNATEAKGTEAQPGKETEAKPAEPVKIKAYAAYTPSPMIPDVDNWEDQLLWKTVEEKFNVDIEWVHTNQEMALIISSGEKYDMIVGISPNDASKYGQEGAFKELTDVYAKMPSFSAILENDPTIRANLTNPDGEVYLFPRLVMDKAANWCGWSVNEALLNKAGVDISTMDTPEGVYEALKKYKEYDPESYPLNSEEGYSLDVFNWFGASYVNKVCVADGKAFYSPTTNEYREAVEYMAKLLKEGLLHPDYVNNKNARQQYVDEKSVMQSGSLVGRMEGYNSSLIAAGKNPGLVAIKTPSVQGDIRWNDRSHYPVNNGLVICASASDEVADKIAQIMDWMYDTGKGSGYETMVHGLEGQHFTYGDDYVPAVGGYINTEELLNDPLYTDRSTYFNNIVGNISAFPTYYGTAAMLALYKTEDGMDGFLNKVPQGYVHSKLPALIYSAEDANEIDMIKGDLDTYVNETTIEWINGTAELNDKTWDDFQNQLKKLMVEEYIDLIQPYYAAFCGR